MIGSGRGTTARSVQDHRRCAAWPEPGILPQEVLMRWITLALVSTLAWGCDDGPAAVDDAETPEASTMDATVMDSAPPVVDADGAVDDDASSRDMSPAPDAGACSAPPDDWEAIAAVGAGPIQEVAVVALDGEVYRIGGFDGPGRIVPAVSAYDPADDAWRVVTPLPVAMHHANAVAADGRIWVLGFLRDRAFGEDGRSFVYDPATEAWAPGPELPAGWHRGASGAAAIDGIIYIVGGFAAGDALSAVHAYDIAGETWSRLPDLPGPPRDHMAAGAVAGQLVIAGGRDTRIGAHVPRTDVFDPATGAWREGAPMPTSRGGAAAAVSGARLYVIGGEGDRSQPTGVFPQVEVYDMACDAWHVLDEMPLPVHGTGAAVIGDWLYVPGGADVQAFGAIDQNARLRVR